MSILKALMAALSVAAIPALLGCEVRALPSAGNPPQQPAQQAQQPAPQAQQPQPATQFVIVREQPPARREEPRPAPPSPDRVWVDGYWNWTGQEYTWVGGTWAVPPHAHAVWEGPRYERHEHGFRIILGGWR